MHPFSTNQLFSTQPSSARGFAWSDQPGHHTDLMLGDRKIVSKAKGFTVVMVMLTGVGSGTGPNLEGQRPWLNDNPATPNPAYFAHVDEVMRLARTNDIHVLIGLYHQTYGNRMTVENARPWAAWVRRRYRDYPNIMWTLYPKAMEGYRPIIFKLAEGIQEGDGGRHLVSIHPDPSSHTKLFMGSARRVRFPDEIMRSRRTHLPIKCWGNSGRLGRARRTNCLSQRPHPGRSRFNASCSTDPDSHRPR